MKISSPFISCADFKTKFTASGIDMKNLTISLEVIVSGPPLPEKSPAYQVVELCKLDKQFYDKNVLLGEVYNCN